ncbi:hypothetical protein HDU93_006519 [Gonapodya sp. JEL0774]|nr:hypothetical protein HDU93_006519 [Gonapodya sp. JEL0774]
MVGCDGGVMFHDGSRGAGEPGGGGGKVFPAERHCEDDEVDMSEDVDMDDANSAGVEDDGWFRVEAGRADEEMSFFDVETEVLVHVVAGPPTDKEEEEGRSNGKGKVAKDDEDPVGGVAKVLVIRGGCEVELGGVLSLDREEVATLKEEVEVKVGTSTAERGVEIEVVVEL